MASCVMANFIEDVASKEGDSQSRAMGDKFSWLIDCCAGDLIAFATIAFSLFG
jgi:hypothetical protein